MPSTEPSEQTLVQSQQSHFRLIEPSWGFLRMSCPFAQPDPDVEMVTPSAGAEDKGLFH